MSINRQAEPYEMITSAIELKGLAESIQHETMIAVDLEADSMFRFKERVCLLQMATVHRNILIDPLQAGDLSALKSVFANEKVQKVMHGADYDIRSLFRDFGIEVRNLFDTELACRFLGSKETGLEAVLAEVFQIQLEKKYQKKNWSQRPLPQDMLEYAAKDVVHLIPLAVHLQNELKQKGRLDWVQEECDILSRVRSVAMNNAPLFLRIQGAGRLDLRSLGVLEGLLQYRLKTAEKKDRPVFKIISNKALIEMAKVQPSDSDQLMALNLLSMKQMHMYAPSILKIIQETQRIPMHELPRYPREKNKRPKPVAPEKLQKLRQWRDSRAGKLGLDPSMLFNKSQLTALALHQFKGKEELSKIEGVRKWQIQEFGEEVTRILDKEKP